MIFSLEGCTQGDPWGPFLWSVGYHDALLRLQTEFPSTQLLAYLDDTYYLDETAPSAHGPGTTAAGRRHVGLKS